MVISEENTTNLHLLNYTGAYEPEHGHDAFTDISFGVGCCITIINIITFCLLLRHRKCFSEHGFWQQLLFLCFSDIISGIAIAVIPLVHHIDFHGDIFYLFCIIGIFLFPLSVTLSAGNCFIISIQRYIVIRSIDKPITSEHRRVTYLMIVGNIFLSFITFSVSVLVVFANFGFKYKEFCNEVNKAGQNEYKSTYIVGSVIILAIFLLGTNISTVLSIVKIRGQGELQPCTNQIPPPHLPPTYNRNNCSWNHEKKSLCDHYLHCNCLCIEYNNSSVFDFCVCINTFQGENRGQDSGDNQPVGVH
jgi:hypothetical protein